MTTIPPTIVALRQGWQDFRSAWKAATGFLLFITALDWALLSPLIAWGLEAIVRSADAVAIATLDRHRRWKGVQGQRVRAEGGHAIDRRKPKVAVLSARCGRLKDPGAFAREKAVRAIELKPIRRGATAVRDFAKLAL